MQKLFALSSSTRTPSINGFDLSDRVGALAQGELSEAQSRGVDLNDRVGALAKGEASEVPWR